MKIILKAKAADDNWDCDYGLVNMTVEDAKRLIDLMDKAQKLKETISSFHSIEIFDYSVEYFGYYEAFSEVKLDDMCAEEILNECNYLYLPEFSLPDQAVVRTEVDTIHVAQDCVHWEANAKHTNVLVATRTIPYFVIENIAKGVKIDSNGNAAVDDGTDVSFVDAVMPTLDGRM
jgi:hypothetical protein